MSILILLSCIKSISSNPSKLFCKFDPFFLFFLFFLSTFWCVAFQRCKRLLPPSRNRFQSGTHLNQHRRKSWKNGGKLGRDHFKIVCSWEMSRMHRRRHGRSMGCRIDFCFTFLYPVFRLASRRSSCRIPWRLTTFANGFSENGNHFMWKSDFRSQRFDFFSKKWKWNLFPQEGLERDLHEATAATGDLGPDIATIPWWTEPARPQWHEVTNVPSFRGSQKTSEKHFFLCKLINIGYK